MSFIIFSIMGNMCCDNESNFYAKNIIKRKICSDDSTKANSTQNPEEQNADPRQIINLLESRKRISKRTHCPQFCHIKLDCKLGKGAQAEVFRASAETRPTSQRHTFSENKIDIVVRKLSKQNKNIFFQSTRLGNQILVEGECQFINKGLFICESKDYFYQGIKLAEGGDLSSFMETTVGKGDAFRKLGEYGVKMVVAGVILALQYLHDRGFIYCDLKPDNVLIGIDGYPLLSDFDLVKKGQQVPSIEFHGTLINVGPEIYANEKFDKSVDLWALGIMIYTLIYNEPPFCIQDIVQNNFCKICKEKENKYALKRKKASAEVIDLINKLLKTNPRERIGFKSMQEIKSHQFFKGLDWNLYEQKKLENPISLIVQKYKKNCKMTESANY